MPMSKDFEFYDLINHQILKIKESGLLQHIQLCYERVYGGVDRTCSSDVRKKGTPIDLHTVISAFGIFLTGFLISNIFFLLENALKKFKRNVRTDENKCTGSIQIKRQLFSCCSEIEQVRSGSL